MKVTKISVLVSKKLGKNFSSWSISYGATAELDNENYKDKILELDKNLRNLVSEGLPSEIKRKIIFHSTK